MSSAGKTEFLGLHSWSRSDPVLCDEFNFNFSAIDRAAADISSRCGSCSIFSGSYSGTGDAAFQLSFPKLPKLLFVQKKGSNAVHTAIVVHGGIISGSSTGSVLSVSGSTIGFKAVSASSAGINENGKEYSYAALGPVQ